jgi:hypothetical protein
MPVNYTDFQNVALAISAYAQEDWVAAKRINSTGIVSSSTEIDTTAEGFTGQLRWYKPFSATVNLASLSSSAAGNYSSLATDIANYIKSARTIGMNQINLQKVISQQDGLAFFAANLAKSRAQDEHAAVLSVLKGVAAKEAAVGAGIVDFTTVPDGSTGAFIDINAAGAFGSVGTGTGRKLVDASQAGAMRGERLFRAMGMAWKDYEPEYAYLITSPELMADFRAANLVDQTRVTDGNLQFQTLFDGKFRLILTSDSQGNNAASANVQDLSTKTSFLVKPNSIAFKEIDLPVSTEINRNAEAYAGGGSTNVWYRYGFVVHPTGYDWVGTTTAFASNAALATAGSWARKLDPLNLGILPIFHS